jgi:hypothetical protein
VENEGRINFWIPKDFKGLLGPVEFGGILLQNWTMTGFPFDSYSQIEKLIELYETGKLVLQKPGNFLKGGPTIFLEIFNLTTDQIHDTFLDPTGWGKVSFLQQENTLNILCNNFRASFLSMASILVDIGHSSVHKSLSTSHKNY